MRLSQAFQVLPLLVAAALFPIGCDDDGGGGGAKDMAAAADLAMPPLADMAKAPDLATVPDLTMPPDMAMKKYDPILLLQDVATTILVQGNPVPARTLVPVVVNNDPALVKHDYDDRAGLLGCFADFYNVGGGRTPLPDVNMGDVTISGYAQNLATLGGTMAPNEIHCALAGPIYACGYGPLVNGMPSMMSTSSTFFLANTMPIVPGSAIRFQFAGAGPMGTYDSAMGAKAVDTITTTEDLNTIKYTTNADAVINIQCPDKPMGVCGADLLLTQLIASSVPAGQMGYPGAEFGTVNCVSVAAGNKLTIKKEAIAALYGGSAKIVQVMTRIARGGFPPPGQMDSKGNSVTVGVGRGVLGFAAK